MMSSESMGYRKRSREAGQEGDRKKHRRSGGSLLPEDLIFSEILTRLPAKSLKKLRCVSKSWQTIIDDPNFMASHLKRAKQQLRVLVLPADYLSSGAVSFHFSSTGCHAEPLVDIRRGVWNIEPTAMPSHCDGLVLFSEDERSYVCNPSTRELVRLPYSTNRNIDPPRMETYNAAAIGHDPVCDKYKVVRLFYRAANIKARSYSLGVEVLTLDSDLRSCKWIPAQQDPPYPLWHTQHAVTVDGVVYWLIDNTLHTLSPQAILGFDMKDGQYKVIPPPPTFDKSSLHLFQDEATIHAINGDLCCTHCCGPVRHVWIYSHGKWHLSHSQQSDVKDLLPLGTSDDGKILLYSETDESFLHYDPENQSKEFIEGRTHQIPSSARVVRYRIHVIPYIESILQICKTETKGRKEEASSSISNDMSPTEIAAEFTRRKFGFSNVLKFIWGHSHAHYFGLHYVRPRLRYYTEEEPDFAAPLIYCAAPLGYYDWSI